MKKGNWFWVLLIIGAVAAFLGYRSMDALRSDTKAPEIRMDTDVLEVSVEEPKRALLQGITAEDSRDGDVTDSLVVESITLLDSTGAARVSCAAFDEAGNVARAERMVTYTDYISPRFVLNKPLIYTQGTNFDILSNVGATDVFDGDIQHRVRATVLGDEPVSAVGTYVVQFQVTNSLGDTHTKSFPVEVVTSDYDNADLSLTQYIVYLPVGSAFNANSYLDSFSYLTNRVSLMSGLPAGFALETKGQVQTQTPGTYSVTYTVTYTQMNEANTAVSREYVGCSKLIVVVEG